MQVKTKGLTLTVTHYKILETVEYLNEQKYYPLSHGVRKILMGEKDDETLMFKECPTYGTLISYPSKKISRYVMMLQRYHYLNKKYDPKTDKLYLEISDLGVASLLKYRKKHKSDYKKKNCPKEVTIVKIS